MNPSPPEEASAKKPRKTRRLDTSEDSGSDFFFSARLIGTGAAVILVLCAPMFFHWDIDYAPFYMVLLSSVLFAVPVWILWFWVTKRECPAILKAMGRLIFAAISALLFFSQ